MLFTYIIMDAEHKVYLWYLIIAVVAVCVGYWIGKETTACASEFMAGNQMVASVPYFSSSQPEEVYTFDNAEIQSGALIAAQAYAHEFSDTIVKSVWQQYFPNIGDINQIFIPEVNIEALMRFNDDNCTGAALFLKVLADKNPSLILNVRTVWKNLFSEVCDIRSFSENY